MNSIIRAPERRLAWNLLNDFDGFFRPVWTGAGDTAVKAFVPALDVSESETDFVVKADLPGVGKDTIEVNIKDGVLTINAEVESGSDENKDGRVIRQERRYGRYARSLALADSVDETRISAEYKDGVLTLVLPKAEPVKAKKIEVKVH